MAQPVWMIYGASGFSGRLIAAEAVRRGHRPILAGRSPEKIRPLAEELSCPWTSFVLTSVNEVAEKLRGLKLVLNCAGPFSLTAAVVARAAIAAKAHYLDITGEIGVIELLARWDQLAKAAGVVLLPAVGFGVVPSDCLAARLADRFPSSRWLRIAFTADRAPSRGTAKSMWEGLLRGGKIRRNGRVEKVPVGKFSRKVEFPSGFRLCLAIPWGDVASAYYTTKIPNIVTFGAFPPLLVGLLRFGYCLSHPLHAIAHGGKDVFAGEVSRQGGDLPRVGGPDRSALPNGQFPGEEMDSRGAGELPGTGRFGWWKRVLRRVGWGLIDRLLSDPTPQEIERSRAEIVAEVGEGDTVAGRAAIVTPGGYRLTAVAAVAAVEQCLAQPPPPGFWTPARALGPDFVFRLPGVQAVSVPD